MRICGNHDTMNFRNYHPLASMVFMFLFVLFKVRVIVGSCMCFGMYMYIRRIGKSCAVSAGSWRTRGSRNLERRGCGTCGGYNTDGKPPWYMLYSRGVAKPFVPWRWLARRRSNPYRYSRTNPPLSLSSSFSPLSRYLTHTDLWHLAHSILRPFDITMFRMTLAKQAEITENERFEWIIIRYVTLALALFSPNFNSLKGFLPFLFFFCTWTVVFSGSNVRKQFRHLRCCNEFFTSSRVHSQ